MFLEAIDTTRLGAHVATGGVNFGLWAPHATQVELVLIDNRNDQHNIDMNRGEHGIWNVFVHGIGPGQLYGYRVHGEWAPHRGLRFNPARLLLDPYARAVNGGVDYRGPIHDHISTDTFELNSTDSFGAVPLGVVVADTPPPPPVVGGRRPMSETVLYEMHVRGFTKMHPLVPEHLRGSFAALAYPDVIDYLRETGVTAVELLPIHHFASEPFVAHKGLRNYWGYNTLSYFAPHAYYATRGTVGNQVDEFKQMVTALHEAGIEVLLDVVYNHTAEGGHEGPTLSMRGIDHAGYYRLTGDLRDDYDVTGCGNSLNTATPMVRQLIMDSLRYWVEHMGVDGFRFDLATELLRNDQHHVDHQHPLKQQIDSDPVLSEVKLIAEPWDIGPYGYQVGGFGRRWSEWNDRFRDHARDYWRGAVHGVQELATRLSGSPDIFNHESGRTPQASINFVTAHDGFTMRDLVSYDVKHNLANGESNRDGSDNNRSWNHGFEGETDDPAINDLRARQVLNLHATQVLAAGTPMLVAGDEFGRTQKGNNNAYCQDSPLSWVHWDIEPRWSQVRRRLVALLRLRAEHPALRPDAYLHHTELLDALGRPLGRVDLAWFNQAGAEMTEQDWYDGGRRLLGMYSSTTSEAFLAYFHSGALPVEVTLPGTPWAFGLRVVWHSGEDGEFPAEDLAPGSELTIPGRSVVLLGCTVPTTADDVHGMSVPMSS
ncbi:glycogen debranching enzyme GlgX [Arachnia propionica]|uniref:Glycogen debranching enzyme GlgX n=1 Tax=Arachnia propionica TaxID=1750 RepID=A0A3P1TCU5_9ACTN|nr:glycogen debranching protein GlgX [Arachnia propionica]RRD07271.1 glycogen debranching enzyme GlgX [Arachnia propionica]